jgi:hypothetical protein
MLGLGHPPLALPRLLDEILFALKDLTMPPPPPPLLLF